MKPFLINSFLTLIFFFSSHSLASTWVRVSDNVLKLSGNLTPEDACWIDMKKSMFVMLILSTFVSPAKALANLNKDEVVASLRKHQCWQSSAFMSLGNSKVSLVAKKWSVTDSLSRITLDEVTNLSIKEGQWSSVSIDLPGQFSINDLTNFPFKGDFQVSKRSDDRLLATVNVGFELLVLFQPSVCTENSSTKYAGDIAVGETPFGLNVPPFQRPMESSPNYIHHKLQESVPVYVDTSFPSLFIDPLNKALKKWNAVLGWNLYQPVSISQDPLDSLDCLSERVLCFFWEGRSDNLGWIGWGGLTGLNFDPQTGEILGSMIALQNASSEKLTPTPEGVFEEMLEMAGLDWVMDFLLRKEEFKKYTHPFPQDLMEHVMLHEIGHANGLKHDFRGSLRGNFEHPSDSVMEYLPFAISHKMNYMGNKDKERIDIVYGRTTPSRPLATCSDAEAKVGNDPNCLQNDVGDPSIWYTNLSDKGERGVFSVVRENQSGLPERPYLEILSKFISNPLVPLEQGDFVSKYLCRQQDFNSVVTYLKDNQHKTLECGR